ncbi:hypothetical protein [Tranquillimonas alkanivorans]|uniref:Uncharacterized protein n=1 Tax=Tranquillimonas alkanivorans TaxID=441119 RepID=A0A1I5QE15_9RHOB|nr:hypothetical protein [Tranquillimonas alkanivorans]SFP44210.1 hypothetical protein SAMN04488047_106184 [Tranquillimonas alkanivorans]
MTALSALATATSRSRGFVGAAAVFVMMLHTCANVVVRNLFNVSMNVNEAEADAKSGPQNA